MGAPSWLRSQLAGPRGRLARPMAHLLNRANSADYAVAVRRLPLYAGDEVLELGFGGGVGVAALLAQGARVTGVEPSLEMRARAYRKHAWALAEGRLVIAAGRAEALPDGPFAHAISMNTVYFWDDVDAGMAELRRAVSSTVLLGVALPEQLTDMQFSESGFRIQTPEWYAEALLRAGFSVAVEHGGPASCSFVIGT